LWDKIRASVKLGADPLPAPSASRLPPRKPLMYLRYYVNDAFLSLL
jgi:hypothetical protein